MPRVVAHTHKLKRFKYKSTGNSIFHCVLADCYFKIETHMALGKKCVCWRCGKEFVINEYSLRLARPHCHSCTKSKTENIKADEIGEEVIAVAADNSMASLKDRLAKISNSGLAAVPDDGVEI